MMMNRTLITFALACVPATALAGDKAQVHIQKAMEAHKAGNFEEARAQLEAAYAFDPKPELLFALGQVNVKLDRCKDAIDYYERFLATNPSAQATSDTKQAIATCQTKLAAAAPPPAPVPGPVASDSPYLPPSAENKRSPWYEDKIGDVLVVSGIAAGAAGLAFYLSARSDLDEAESAVDLKTYEDRVDSAHAKRTFSVVLVGSGAILIGAGIARYVLRDGGGGKERGVAVVPTSGGGLVTFSGGF